MKSERIQTVHLREVEEQISDQRLDHFSTFMITINSNISCRCVYHASATPTSSSSISDHCTLSREDGTNTIFNDFDVKPFT